MDPSSQPLDMSTQARARRALDVPLLRFLDVSALDEDLTKGLSVRLSPNALNAVGGVHAGALATILEVTAYLAIVPTLGETEEAITHDFHASYVGRIDPSATLRSRGSVIRRGARTAFVRAELHSGDDLVATATVTKSIRSIG